MRYGRRIPLMAAALGVLLAGPAAGQYAAPPGYYDLNARQYRVERYDLHTQSNLSERPTDLADADAYAAGLFADEAKSDGSKKAQKSVEERLAELEKAYQKDVEAAAKKKADDDKKKADDAKKPSIRFSGFIHTDYWALPEVDRQVGLLDAPDGNPEDHFQFRRIRLAARGDIADNMLYKLDMDFSVPNNPQIKDMYIGWTELPVLQTVLLGNQKRPYGLDYLNSSNANVFLERPLIVEALNPGVRRFGIASYGYSEDEVYNWRYGAFMGSDLQSTGTAFATPGDEDYQPEIAGRFANTFWYDECSDGRGYGHWAIAGAYASPDGDAPVNSTARFQTRPEARTANNWIDTGVIATARNYGLIASEFVLNFGALNFTAEYQRAWVDRATGNNLSFHGGYAELSYVLTGEHHPWDRRTGTLKSLVPFENAFLVRTCDGCIGNGWGAWEVAVRYSYADFSDDNIFGGEVSAVTFGMQWHMNPYARLQANYVVGEMQNRFANDVVNAAKDRNGSYQIFGARLIVVF